MQYGVMFPLDAMIDRRPVIFSDKLDSLEQSAHPWSGFSKAKSVNWQAAATVGGMMSVGLALEKTGAAEALAQSLKVTGRRSIRGLEGVQ
jgi:hypothetical protein